MKRNDFCIGLSSRVIDILTLNLAVILHVDTNEPHFIQLSINCWLCFQACLSTDNLIQRGNQMSPRIESKPTRTYYVTRDKLYKPCQKWLTFSFHIAKANNLIYVYVFVWMKKLVWKSGKCYTIIPLSVNDEHSLNKCHSGIPSNVC